jgi:hypothetical protein
MMTRFILISPLSLSLNAYEGDNPLQRDARHQTSARTRKFLVTRGQPDVSEMRVWAAHERINVT